MKKSARIVIALVAVVAIVLPLSLFAAQFRVGNQTTLGAQETINNDLYIAGGSVSTAGVVTGDLLAAGGNVLINSKVGQDALLAGGTITILGDVADDVRVAGGNITITGAIGGDLIAGGGQINIAGGNIGGDAAIGGGVVWIGAPIAGNVRLGAGEVHINAPITGDVTIDANKIFLENGAKINGSLTYTSPQEAEIAPGQVAGRVMFNPRATHAQKTNIIGIALSVWLLVRFLMLLTAALVLGLIFKRYAKNIVEGGLKKPLLELGRGFVSVVVIPAASIVLLITIIGVPLGILGLIGFVVFMMFGYIFAPILLGSLLYKWFGKKEGHTITWLSILLGVVVFCLFGWVPFIGWIIRCILVLITLGAIARMKMTFVKDFR